MNFIQEKIINLNIGVSKEYKIIQFSDVHITTYYSSDSIEVKEKAILQDTFWKKQRMDFAHKFNEEIHPKMILSSTECLSNLIDYSNVNQSDLVLLTGDLVDYYSEANYKYLKKSLMKIQSPYLYACGNHESPCDKFEELCKGNCDFNYIDFQEFFVVSINDSKRTINQYQLESLEKLISLKKPIILAMHIPMMTKYNEEAFLKIDSYYSMRYNDCDTITSRFISLVGSSPEVKAVFCGHTHGAISSFVSPEVPQYCCSSGLIGSVNKIIIR